MTVNHDVSQPRLLAGLLLAACSLVACVTEERPKELPNAPKRQVRAWTEAPGKPVARSAPRPVDSALIEDKGAPDPGTPFAPGLVSPVAPLLAAQESPDEAIGSEVLTSSRRQAHQTIRAADGRFTRLYWLRAKTGARVAALITKHTRAGDPALAVIEVTPDALADPRLGPAAAPLNTLVPSTGTVSDLLTITADAEVLDEVDQFLNALLAGTPMIEIEANVVEITSADNLRIGTDFSLVEGGTRYTKKADGTPDFSKPIGNADDKSTLFDDFSFLDPSNQNFSGTNGQLSLAIMTGDYRLRAVIRALQDTGNAELLSAPKMAVLNGHRAVIDTGQKTPVLQPVLNQSGVLTQVQVKFEDTGIFLVVTPYLLMDDLIQIDVSAEVSAVTGFIESGATGIFNPIISNRNASTVVNVRDGQTFAIGGLLATDEIEQVQKVPLLGDIPLLGWLFKTSSVTERQSQVIFILKPRILRQEGSIINPEQLHGDAGYP